VDLSGIIFVALALAWAGFLIPKMLKRHGEDARTGSGERLSAAVRVLARRVPVNSRRARLVVTPSRSARPRTARSSAVGVAAQPAGPDAGRGLARPDAGPARAPALASARAAARRRRRILAFLLFVDVVVVGVAALHYVPWWSVSIPGGLTLVYVLLCRLQARRVRRRLLARVEAGRVARTRSRPEVTAARSARAAGPLDAQSRAAGQAVAGPVAQHGADRHGAAGQGAGGQGVGVVEQGTGRPEVGWQSAVEEDTVVIYRIVEAEPPPAAAYPRESAPLPGAESEVGAGSARVGPPTVDATPASASPYAVAEGQTAPVTQAPPITVQTIQAGSLWDPLPMTLPTYVSKPAAPRTVRTIDLNEPGTWSSGRSESDSQLVEDAASAGEETSAESSAQRAVGS
jgi:hypothetical protein